MEAEDIEKCETVVRETVRYERTGMSLGMKSDIGVCVTMILLTIHSVFITAFKILLIDMKHFSQTGPEKNRRSRK